MSYEFFKECVIMEDGYLGEAESRSISMCFALSFHSNRSEIEVGLVLYPCKEKAGLNFHFRLFLTVPRDCFSQGN